MARHRPWSDAETTRLAQLHAAGRSLTSIATEMGRSKSTINRIAAEIGITWDRTRTRVATDAHRDDARERRARVSVQLMRRAEEFLAQMDQEFLAFNFGGKDNTYAEQRLDRPPTGDIRNLMTSVGIAVAKHAELEQIDSDAGAGEAISLLETVANSIGLDE